MTDGPFIRDIKFRGLSDIELDSMVEERRNKARDEALAGNGERASELKLTAELLDFYKNV